MKGYVHTSLTRIADFRTTPFDVVELGRDNWATGDYVVGLVEGKPDAGRVKLADLSTNALGLDSVPDEGRRKHYAEKYGPVLRALVELAGELPAEHPFAGDSEPRRLFAEALGAPPYA